MPALSSIQGKCKFYHIPEAVSSLPWAGILIHPAESAAPRLHLASESHRLGEQISHRTLGYTGWRDLLSQIGMLAFIHTPCTLISVWHSNINFREMSYLCVIYRVTRAVLRRLTDVETSTYWLHIIGNDWLNYARLSLDPLAKNAEQTADPAYVSLYR